ncbi:putative aryl-alcohol dehydrogenase [Wickerhamomyces ciferrii]|uniref:Aryl-alcohol dehydrogenase n=1 Tax=Wickerhamomyces ciferrii (strain ATCC 14091 / BCRC 22168 / CBS 111 / JCM 3599 / NBRC 0793 / NRRL Y-1031 F-60-10) TaxID=1206466 RepID=K0KJE8_WICCF|nr:putative aryl-alcohol dehydrogenase [Wickerhamomyces ciferrii]CCH45365.1 putative aryl-alcohol dehydrogenase [Wickerhamomyces ciferrii]
MSEVTQYVPWNNLGSSGLKISKIIIGFMSFGSKEYWEKWVIDDKEKIFGILKKAYDHGIRTYDTADTYSNGLSEKILGEFLTKYKIKRDKVIILTKVFYPIDDEEYPVGFNALGVNYGSELDKINFANNQRLSRKHIIDAAKKSVERLGTYIDVYQIHRFDHYTPMEETMKALNDVVEAGYTRYIGASSMRAVQFVQLQHTAEKHGWSKFISMQSFYNLINREDENEMNFYCDQTGVGLIPWSPIATGVLARPVPKDESEFTERHATTGFNEYLGLDITRGDPSKESEVETIDRVEELSKKRGVPMAAIATAWVISKGANPIIGFSSEKRVDDAILATQLKLTDEEIKYLEEPYKPKQRIFSSI